METKTVQLKELHQNKRNPRRITDADKERLVNSLLCFPKMLDARPIVVNGKGVIIGGNMRCKALRQIAKMDAGEIQARLFELREYRQKAAREKNGILTYWQSWLASKTVTVVYADSLSEAEQREFMVKDNAHFGDWDIEEFESPSWDGVNFEAWGVDFQPKGEGCAVAGAATSEEEDDDPDDDIDEGEDDGYADDEDDGDDASDAPFGAGMYKDVLYESDNDLDIPNLLLERQAGKLELPFAGWGSVSRSRVDMATYHFYVDDYRFEALFRDPAKLVNSGCKAIVEPNCSLHDQTPIAFGLNQIYKKRYLARYCQELGIDVYVDLNVAEKFRPYNRMGVPQGYNAFMTRGLEGWMESLRNDLEEARQISGLDKPNLIVYGGGKEVQRFCQEHGLLYVTDFINAKKLYIGKGSVARTYKTIGYK